MKKLLLTGCLAAATLAAAAASPSVYFGDEIGNLNGVSDNGRYVVVSDEDDGIAYLWCADDPDVFADISEALGASNIPSGQRVNGTHVYDVSDHGMAVGSIGYADGHSVAAYYDIETQEWTPLERPANALNTVEAVAVTPDGKIIAGYFCIANRELEFGQYYPCQWKLNEEGEYDLYAYDYIQLPFHQGFFPLAQSPDGNVISGMCFAGMMSTIPALIVDGELVLFNEIDEVSEPWIYRGKYFCGYDENGYQIWTDDPDDPRIVYYSEEYIDGYRDGEVGELNGYLAFCDGEGNFYGMHSWYETSVDAYGNEDVTVESAACIYNFNTNEWEDYFFTPAFTCGTGEDLIFTADNQVMTEDDLETVNEYYDFSAPAGHINVGVSKVSLDGSVIGGITGLFSEAIMDYFYYPYVIVTDKYSGVKTTLGGENVSVVLSRGHIEVRNADDATIYDIEGRIAAQGTSADLNPGAYVVKTADKSIKVIVK